MHRMRRVRPRRACVRRPERARIEAGFRRSLSFSAGSASGPETRRSMLRTPREASEPGSDLGADRFVEDEAFATMGSCDVVELVTPTASGRSGRSRAPKALRDRLRSSARRARPGIVWGTPGEHARAAGSRRREENTPDLSPPARGPHANAPVHAALQLTATVSLE